MQICVATDLSTSGLVAVNHAMAWAEAHGAKVRLVHVVHDPVLAPALSNDVPGDVARAGEALDEIARRAPVTCEVDVRTAEDLSAEIVKAAEGSAYLFVGSQGKSPFERLRVGSVATAVIRHSTVPVVCCPHPEQAG
ncbi:MAG: universal stress protein [Planctomycetes bacterium]|nr:universal stress protein [Planctomycetota bacterium]